MIAIQESRIVHSSDAAASMIHQHYMQSDITAASLGPVMQQQQQQQQQQQSQQQIHHQQRQHQQQRRQPQSSASSASTSPNQSDNNSMSTATPPHQISQRASPASTALVMSNNNINGAMQPSSRQLTPNTSSSNNGTGSSSNGNTGHGQHHNGGAGVDGSGAPNPMARQFALHTKSMSAGIVVPVPGISNNLATAAGMNQNNVVNNNIATSNHHHQPPAHAPPTTHHHHHHHRTNGIIAGNNALGANSMVPPYNASNRMHHNAAGVSSSANHHHSSSANSNNNDSNQVMTQQAPNHAIVPPYRTSKSSSHHRSNSHQHRQLSQINPQQAHHHHMQQPQNPQSLSQGLYQHNDQEATHPGHHQHDHHAPYHTNGSSDQFLHHELPARQQTTSSSIVLNNNNINNVHGRSASTHLSNILLGPNGQSHHHQQQSRNFHQQHTQQQPQHMSNSIWTIGENISKSHSKLTASSYLHQPYLFNAPLTNVSCDNISNPSRLIDGAPAPGYYLQAPNNLPNSNAHLSTTGSMKTPEFLPICDLMFNFISMIIYFCESTFGIIALIALYYHATGKHWALMGAMFVVASNAICQYTSLRWIYKSKLEQCERKQKAQNDLAEEENCERRCYNRMSANMRNYPCGSCNWLPEGPTEVQLRFLISIVLHSISHLFCLGFLIRYIKLVIPITDTSRVKREARDLSMLRLIHGFIQSAPLLLLQSYLIASQNSAGSVANLSMISAILSLVNVCWALASFTKYARKKYMHKFVLTWLGIMSQFLWRLGTVSSRIATLVIYAVYYNYWMLVILALHWLTMFCWLMKPGNLLRDEVNMSRAKKLAHALGTSWIYCFCYVNFEEHNSRAKTGSFYMIMFFENNVLFSVCLFFTSQSTWFKSLSMLVIYLGFALGMIFMYLYYKFFHVSALDSSLSCSQDSIDSIADQLSPAGKKIAGFKPGTLRLRSEDSLTSDRRFIDNISTTLRTGSHPEITRGIKPQYLGPNQVSLPESGVFDCKLNTARPKDRKSTETYHCS